MIEKYFGQYTPICDYCEKRLPGEHTFEGAARAAAAAGWETRGGPDDREHVCTDCLFEEKGYSEKDAPDPRKGMLENARY